jgi:hypothetical protein
LARHPGFRLRGTNAVGADGSPIDQGAVKTLSTC